MGLGVSLILVVLGATGIWAVNYDTSTVDLNTIGVILLVVGGIGVLLSLVFWSSWGGSAFSRRRTTYVDDR
jgi:hypothetical protein